MNRIWRLAMAAAGIGLPVVTTYAQNVEPAKPEACIGIETDSQRLACYDQALGRDQLPGTSPTTVQHGESTKKKKGSHLIFGGESRRYATTGSEASESPKLPTSLMDSRWELSEDSKLGTYNVRGYQPVYLLPVFYTSSVNNRPSSPSPDNTVSNSQHLDPIEAKFQISLKTKLWQGVFGDAGDLWFGYTQSSRWQLYNDKASRPFRETNYEPEAMLVFNTNYHVLGWNGRLLGIGLDHQSNGRSDPLSRSWNRVIADIGFERGSWTVMFRPWWRIHETRDKDDNPDIEDYMGRGEVQIVHEWKANEFALTARHSLRGGDRSHGSARFSWSFPIHDKLRGYMEVFNGYGESMIDYNHHATYLGLGVSLLGWY